MDYWAYGLRISSNVEIRPFWPRQDSANSDIQFQVGSPPTWVNELALANGNVVYSPALPGQADSKLTITSFLSGRFLELRYDDGTRFVMDNGATKVWAEAGRGFGLDDIFTYLVGPIMGFVSRRRQKLALHASAVAISGHAIALCGEPGSGKSTTAAALALRGNPVLCEDVCVLQNIQGSQHVTPGYPRISLWADSAAALFPSLDCLPLITRTWEKRYLSLDGRVAAFRQDPATLTATYLLAPRADAAAAPFIEPLSQREAVLALVQNTYMNYLLSKEQRAAEFYAIVNLVREVDCYRVTPNADPSRIVDLASLIESHASKVISGKESSTARAVRADVQP